MNVPAGIFIFIEAENIIHLLPKERGLNNLPATSPPSPLSMAGEGEFG